jgi:transcriptional regulator GlxA family with amidase domain
MISVLLLRLRLSLRILAVSAVTPELLDATIRLVRLLATSGDIPVLAPLAEREILYRLLHGEQASRMDQIAFTESKLQQVNRAISWIKRNFREPFSIDAVANEARMSPWLYISTSRP